MHEKNSNEKKERQSSLKFGARVFGHIFVGIFLLSLNLLMLFGIWRSFYSNDIRYYTYDGKKYSVHINENKGDMMVVLQSGGTVISKIISSSVSNQEAFYNKNTDIPMSRIMRRNYEKIVRYMLTETDGGALYED